MYQGGLCCLLITMMTICVANQVSGPEAELTKHQRTEHGNNGLHDAHHNKGHVGGSKKSAVETSELFIFTLK